MLLGELRRGRRESQAQFLQTPRHPHRPALVTEVALDLAHDRGSRVGRELHPAVRVETVDRLDQADGGDLGEVVQRLAAVAEAAREVLDERQVHADQLVAQLRVLRAAVLQRAQLDEQGACPAAVMGVVPRDRRVVRARHAVLCVSLVLAHRPARRPSTSPRLRRHREDPGPPCRRRTLHGTFPIPLPVVQEAGCRGVDGALLRMRPRLLGDAVDAVSHASGTAGAVVAQAVGAARARKAVSALGRQLPCAALFVPHRPVPVPHAGPGPAPRCL